MSKNHLISQQVEEYIAYKKGLGYKLQVESEELRRFARYAKEINHSGSVTIELALKWASLKPGYTRWYKARRLETVHTFAKYVAVFDPQTQIPSASVFGSCHGRTTPYIVSKEEIKLLIQASKNLHSPDGLRALTTSTILALLWSSGLRPSEACNLTMNDVDLLQGILHIRETKFNKDRYVPVHETTRQALAEYLCKRDSLLSQIEDPHFFLSTGGKGIKLRNLEYAMQLIRNCLLGENQKTWTGRAPRLYDLRHSFASITILRWMKNGEDVNHKLLQLSVYLGHVKPSDTYWYLTGIPEIADLACKHFEKCFLSTCTGGAYEE